MAISTIIDVWKQAKNFEPGDYLQVKGGVWHKVVGEIHDPSGLADIVCVLFENGKEYNYRNDGTRYSTRQIEEI